MLTTENDDNSESRRDAARLSVIADALPAYIAYVDDGLRYRMVNRAYEQALGMRREQMIGRLVADVVGRSFEVIGAHLRAALTGVEQRFETRLQTVEGERILGVSQMPDVDAQGRVRGVIVYGVDITERERIATELRGSDERLQMALAAANGVGMWDWDLPSDKVRSDATFALFFGVDLERARAGASVAEFTRNVYLEDRPRLEQAIERAVRDGGEFNEEYRIVRADGSVCWLSTRGRCTYALDGTPLRFPGVAIDITKRKLSEGALVRAEKLAAVGRLASSIAHEINNPLESVVNLLFLIEHGVHEDPEKAREWAQMAQAELARVSQIVTQTLRFFKQSTRPTVVQAPELVGSVLALYQGRLANSNIEVSRRVRKDAAGLSFEGELRQVLNNLIGNALDAMREHGGRLHIRAWSASSVKDRRRGFRIFVADNGTGMNELTVKRVFEPFFTTKGIMGTGLGLWVSHEIVAKHHGTLRVRSSQKSGRTGTVFSLFVPFEAD